MKRFNFFGNRLIIAIVFTVLVVLDANIAVAGETGSTPILEGLHRLWNLIWSQIWQVVTTVWQFVWGLIYLLSPIFAPIFSPLGNYIDRNKDTIHIISSVVTVLAFLLLSVGDIRRYLWRNLIKGNWLYLRDINCPPQFFDLKIKRDKDQNHSVVYRFLRCPPGTFRMGSPVTERGHQEDEKLHTVTLSRAFWIGETPVTNELWHEIMLPQDENDANSTIHQGTYLTETEQKQAAEAAEKYRQKRKDKPVVGKSWYECQIFIKKLNEKLENDEKKFGKNILPLLKNVLHRGSMDKEKKKLIISSNGWCIEPQFFPQRFSYPMQRIRWLISYVLWVIFAYLPVLLSLLLWIPAVVLRKVTHSRIDLCAFILDTLKSVVPFPNNFRFSLPSEAQWEYACRTRWHTFWEPTAYCYGNSIDGKDGQIPLSTYAWFCENRADDADIRDVSSHNTSEDKKKDEKQYNIPNIWGIYEMHGSVWEWVNDWYGAYSAANDINQAVVDPTGPITSKNTKERVARGGSCQRTAYGCRSARRQSREPIWEHERFGFRLVLVHKDNPSNLKVVRLSSSPIRFYYGEDRSVVFNFRKCPAGAFRMGTREEDWKLIPGEKKDDETRHIVAFGRDFYISETTVTQKQWEYVMKTCLSSIDKETGKLIWREDDGSCTDVEDEHLKEYENLPVAGVNWYDALAFVATLNAATGKEDDKSIVLPNDCKDYRFVLPTEAMWEYACRADKDNGECHFCYGKKDTFAEKLHDYACYRYQYPPEMNKPNPIRRVSVSKEIGNNWLIYDMHGNVREWCMDWYRQNYLDPLDKKGRSKDYDYETGTPKMKVNPPGPKEGTERVLRGGSYKKEAADCRSASRDKAEPSTRESDIGFRVALVSMSSPIYRKFRELLNDAVKNENIIKKEDKDKARRYYAT